MTETTPAATPDVVTDPLMARFLDVVREAQEAKDLRESASSAAGTTFLDALNKSADSEVSSIKSEIETHTRALNGWKETRDDGTIAEHVGLRDQAKARLVEVGELSGEAASLDKYREDASEKRAKVRAMFDALIGANIVTDESDREAIEKAARPILGKDRGRKASDS